MLKIDEINKIKKEYFLQEKTKHQIAKKFNRSWSTINKCIKNANSFQKKAKQIRRKRVLTSEIINHIKKYLDEEKQINCPRKQRYRAKFIYKKLREETNYRGSLSHLSCCLKNIRKEQKQELKKQQSFLELHFTHGDYIQFDHGPVRIKIAGDIIDGYLFTASIPGVVLRYCQFYITKDVVSWSDFHERAFRHYGGIFKKCIYDNDSAIIIAKTREPTSLFSDVLSYYNFKYILCNKGSGWEKGSVENAVGYCRRNFLAGICNFSSIEELNQYLSEEIAKDENINNHYKTGKLLKEGWNTINSRLNPLKEVKQWGKWSDHVVNNCQQLTIGKYNYSVPEKYIGSTCKCFKTVTHLLIYDTNNDFIYKHKRCYFSKEDGIVFEHFYTQLLRKPRAFNYAKVVQKHKFPEYLNKLYKRLETIKDKLSNHHNQEFIKILMLKRQCSEESFKTAVEVALSFGGITFSAIKSILKQLNNKEVISNCPDELLPLSCRIKIETRSNLEQYDQLI